MSTPPWGHKPPKVDDHYRYWREPPPELSPRVQYWLKRFADGNWRPNRSFNMEDYDTKTQILGVYMWEYLQLMFWLFTYDEDHHTWWSEAIPEPEGRGEGHDIERRPE